MADVLLIFVREDLDAAEALASACEFAGLVVHAGAPDAAENGAYRTALVVWSEAAQGSEAFLDAAQHALAAGKALIADLSDAPLPDVLAGAPDFDLSGWDGESDTPQLTAVLDAIRRRARFADMMTDLKTFATAQTAAPVAAAAPAMAEDEPLELSMLAPAIEPEIEPEPALVAAEPEPAAPPRRRPARAQPAPRPAQNPTSARKTGRALHELSQALFVAAGAFVLIMAGGILFGPLAPQNPPAAAIQAAEAAASPAPTAPQAAPAPTQTAAAEPEAAAPALEAEAPRPRPARRAAAVRGGLMQAAYYPGAPLEVAAEPAAEAEAPRRRPHIFYRHGSK